MAGRLTPRRALAALCVFVVGAGLWNAARYPPQLGYDAVDHIAYADGLVPGGALPHGVGEYYTPPGYYAVAGAVDWVAAKAGVGEPHRAGMALDVLFLLGAVLLTWQIARELWPEREWRAFAAAAFVALVPRTIEMAAMFQPSTFALFLCTLALWLCARTFADRRYALALGVALGLAQLVQAAALWTVAVTLIALAVGRRWRELSLALVLAVAIPLPWYVHQQTTYSGLAPFPRPATPPARAGGVQSGKAKPLYDRRPLGFYVDLGLPDVFWRPYRQHFNNRLLPTSYSELWGDYFAHWAWNGSGPPSSGVRAELRVQSIVGVLPTVLAVAGWLAFLWRSVRSPPRLAVALLPLVGLLGYLYFTVAYPTPDGDVIKASYMLTATAGWALGFAYAVDSLRGRLRLPVLVLLGVGAAASLPFLIYG